MEAHCTTADSPVSFVLYCNVVCCCCACCVCDYSCSLIELQDGVFTNLPFSWASYYSVFVFSSHCSCHGEDAVNKEALKTSLTELKASEEDFSALFTKTKELTQPLTHSI